MLNLFATFVTLEYALLLERSQASFEVDGFFFHMDEFFTSNIIFFFLNRKILLGQNFC